MQALLKQFLINIKNNKHRGVHHSGLIVKIRKPFWISVQMTKPIFVT